MIICNVPRYLIKLGREDHQEYGRLEGLSDSRSSVTQRRSTLHYVSNDKNVPARNQIIFDKTLAFCHLKLSANTVGPH